ncbi:hypothetical protein BGZ51_008187 [Haplosporangium sp. Z 767]|nr:hypothetical protein BGZ50_008250 [Haplosporangium sp. Z 11]KAF9178002.1 hypothetical protein BGZ51_008187 [Haplosporangium sp. Z 767]
MVDLKLLCLVDGEPTSKIFSVKITSDDIVSDLKKLIKTENAVEFKDADANDLTLWRVSIPVDPAKKYDVVSLDAVDSKQELMPTDNLSDVFVEDPPKKTIHIIVQRLPPGEEWRKRISKIESDFFASESWLVDFVRGGAKVPTTEGNLGGLPCIRSRASGEANRPSLLFLNLPESSESQDAPSTADKALKRIRMRAIPLLTFFGVTGCGKTRTVIEMLSKNWGFYFNASDTDLGSDDLVYLLKLAQKRKLDKTRDTESNNNIHIMALALVLTRTIILYHCLNIAERERTTFTCKDWMLLQVGIHTMGVKDLFATLFALIMAEIDLRFIGIAPMTAIVHERFSKLRQRLLGLTCNTSSERFDYTILLVVDEAQTLGKIEFGTFLSQQIPIESEGQAGAASPDYYVRSILSPLVHGFYLTAADKNEFCVIPCGTGLSIFEMRWLEDAGSGPKGHAKQLRPFTDFVGWSSLEQVQNYRNLVRRSLPNDKAKIIFDSHVPLVATPELFERLHGRFRPIVFAIERMIMLPDNGNIGWKETIEEADEMLTSTDSQHFVKGNIAYDIARMIRRVHEFPSRYAKYQNIHATLKTFVLEHYLHGRPLILNEEEAPLVEASVGRILHFGGEATTVLDEPFALRAAVNYFRQYDPDFHSAICTLLGSGSTASVHGHQWELAALPSLAHVFHDKTLSEADLVPKGAKSCDPLLGHNAKIAGYVNHLTLGTDFESMSLDSFLDAHVNHDSCKDGKPVPPFYRPTETPSGPDVAFVLYFDNHGFCPVFIQLKMRHKMTKVGAQGAFSTVKSEAVEGDLQESMLQMFCTGNPKRFLGVVITYPAELAGVEIMFPQVRRSERICSAQGESPQCILLRIDKNNIHSLFPKNHMQALDLLKEIKRQLDPFERSQGSDVHKDEPATK